MKNDSFAKWVMGEMDQMLSTGIHCVNNLRFWVMQFHLGWQCYDSASETNKNCTWFKDMENVPCKNVWYIPVAYLGHC